MTYVARARETTIRESLRECAPLVEKVGQGEWNFILNNGSALLVSACATEHWLHLDAPLRCDAAQGGLDAWHLLKLNRGLGGLSKLALLQPGQTALRVRAEIPLDEDVDLQRRLLEACAGLKSAAGRLHGEEKEELTRVDSLAATEEWKKEQDGSELQTLCAEAGWKFTERGQGKLAVELETRTGFYQAIMEERAEGAVSVAVEVARDATFGENSRRAIGTLLLRASAHIKLARAVVFDGGEGSAAASFETLFQTRPCAAEVNHALSALAVACGLCGGAAEAMRDEAVAANYLAAQGLKLKLN
ncbi:MAG TPA: hypothetical protein VM095_02255 [Pyrinomonadaceae bacterium]|nr:hypothetical protein [Pyrinomonadaceae bacterium]